MDSNSTRTPRAVARENHHTSPWLSSSDLDAIVEAFEGPKLVATGAKLGAKPATSSSSRATSLDAANAWREARARLDRALAARDAMLSRPVSQWPRDEAEVEEATRALAWARRALYANEEAKLVAEWRAAVERETGEPPRRPWSQLELWGSR